MFVTLNGATAEVVEKVESVEVQLSVSGRIYEGLQERIEFSISRVGEKLLLDRPLALLNENKESVRQAIFNVFTKVLTGFTVESTELFPGTHTKVVIHLKPVPPLINELKLQITAETLDPEMKQLLQSISRKAEGELSQYFTGLPVAAASWSEEILNLVARYILERELPGFKFNFSFQPGATTLLSLNLIPREPVITEVKIDYSAENIPLWFLRRRAERYQAQFNLIKGLPVDFAVHYQTVLESYFKNRTGNFSEFHNLGLAVELTLNPAPRTVAQLVIHPVNYQIRMEGRYFLGQESSFGNLQCYVGYHNDDYDFFLRFFGGDNPTGSVKIGISVPLERNFTGGFEYDLNEHWKDFWFHYQFERGDYLDLRLGVGGAPNEALIGVYLTKHTSLELVKYEQDFGIQFMFHF
jgi:hypothetical protein